MMQAFVVGIISGLFVWYITSRIWKPDIRLSDKIAFSEQGHFVIKMQNRSWFRKAYDITICVQYCYADETYSIERPRNIGMLKSKPIFRSHYAEKNNSPYELKFKLVGPTTNRKKKKTNARCVFEEHKDIVKIIPCIDVVITCSDAFSGSARHVFSTDTFTKTLHQKELFSQRILWHPRK